MKQILMFALLFGCSYLSAAAPMITNITPNNGPSSGGTSVTISGSGFTGATEVDVDGVAVSSFTVVNDTTITFTSAIHVPENVTVVVIAPSGTSPPNHPNDFFTYTGDWTVFVPINDSGNVYPINAQTSVLGAAIPVGGGPRDVAIDPFGKFAYVLGNTNNTLTVINIATDAIIPVPLTLPLNGPLVMAIHPTLPKAYITYQNSDDFTVINLTNPSQPSVTSNVHLALGEHSEGVAFLPDGSFACVGGTVSDQMYKIDATSDAVLPPPYAHTCRGST